MLRVKEYSFWFVTGSQDLYGEETLKQVAVDSQKIVEGLNEVDSIKYNIIYKPTVRNAKEIYDVCLAANNDENCAGIITWMHTFSPAKMWIRGLSILNKPQLHFHTQFNRDIPWDTMDMDFMNLNQSAHGDREFGFINARMGNKRKVIVGHWQDEEVHKDINKWMSVAAAFVEGQNIKIARFDDNMRNVAVTEGDKVEAAIKLGWTCDAFGIGDLVEEIEKVTSNEVEELIKIYEEKYDFCEEGKIEGSVRNAIKYQAKVEVALRRFLEKGDYTAFTTNFQVLHGMEQLPGLAVQRLMEDGYGFGGEGDWKTAGLVRLMKIMSNNIGTSFMEDYTYHFEPGNEMILGAHMLEVCPTVAANKPRIDVKPLSIGDKNDPARLIFSGQSGKAVCASLIDLGGRMRLIINEVNAKEVEKDLPNLPVARVLWTPEPSLKVGAEAWILAGGAHHTSFSYVVDAESLCYLADMYGLEAVVIGENTNIRDFSNELKWNSIYWMLNK
ncbi:MULTISPECIES: L-arabinose isomerase [unclassified Clostridium]|uniref:L-arabinose isomerase n=1 Tax=unclassified Clostridium TaxID=2614128 RepID=UPI00189925DF|nr:MULTISPECIES: L-arabinose isomerase [unclassified Clostridium]